MAFRRSGVRVPLAPPTPADRRPLLDPLAGTGGGSRSLPEPAERCPTRPTTARPTRARRPGRRAHRIERYDPTSIEPRWQARWDELGLYRTDLHDTSRPQFYLLTMYPYPSGDLHIGHWYIKTPTDAIARYHRMHGENVFLPIGFDAFGLPAENAAIKNNINPRDWTMSNIENMRRQLRSMGATFDWDAEVVTADPDVLPLEPVVLPAVPEGRASPTARRRRSTGARTTGRSPASRSRAPTATAGGAARRSRSATSTSGTCGSTKYADELLDFIGHRLAGADPDPADELDRAVRGRRDRLRDRAVRRTTRAARSCACSRPARTRCSGRRSWSSRRSIRSSRTLTAPERRAEVEAYVAAGRDPDRDRAAVDRPREDRRRDRRRRDQPGQRRADPDLRRRLRPRRLRHRRDHGRPGPRRARLRVRREVRAADPAGRRRARRRGPRPGSTARTSPTRPTRCSSTAAPYSGLPGGRGRRARSSAALEAEGKGKAAVTYRLRDWLISRQRYWGTPIPVIYCDRRRRSCRCPRRTCRSACPTPSTTAGSGENPLTRDEAFLNVAVPGRAAGRRAARPTRWTRSSTRPGTGIATCRREKAGGPIDADLVERWTPVDQYTGGAEHAVMHLLYAREFTKMMRDIGLVEQDEPFKRLFNQGQILGTRRRADVEVARQHRQDPDELVARYGADTVRLFLMFMGPWDQGGPWSPTGIGGVHRFLNRLWTIALDPHGREPGDPGERARCRRARTRPPPGRRSARPPTGRCAT